MAEHDAAEEKTIGSTASRTQGADTPPHEKEPAGLDASRTQLEKNDDVESLAKEKARAHADTEDEAYYPEGGWKAWGTVMGAYVSLSLIAVRRDSLNCYAI